MVGIKRFKLIIGIFIPFLTIFLMSQNVFADSLSTASLDLYYIPVSASNYIWRNGMLYNQSQQLWQAKKFQFNTPSVIANGTNAVIHFETNIVASQPAHSSGINQSHYVNLDYMTNLSCSASNGNLSIIGSSLSYARTPWFSNNNYTFNETLTLYGDIALKGFDKNTSGTITCAVGSNDYAFYNSDNYLSTSYTLYFEQNPMTIIWTDNNTDNLLQQQISQTQQLIYQNQQLYEQNNQNTQNIINNQNQNTQDIIKSNQKCVKNLFTGDFSQFNSSGGSGSTYAYFKLPDDDVYTLTLIAKNSVIGSSTTYLGFTATGGSTTDPRIWAFGSSSNGNAGSVFSISNVVNGQKLHFVSLYNKYSANLNWFLDNFDIQIEKGSSFSSFVPYGQEICKNINEQYYDEQRQADQNISNQSSSDISGAENQATTNLIGVLSGFISAFSNINATNCNLTLEFPDYAGGSRIVNICSGKEKAPRIIEIGSSLLLIGVFVPLAYILIRMIYNEIRSWTNG